MMIFRRAHFCIYHLNDISCLNHATKLTGFGASSLALVGLHSGSIIGNISVSVRRVIHAEARETKVWVTKRKKRLLSSDGPYLCMERLRNNHPKCSAINGPVYNCTLRCAEIWDYGSMNFLDSTDESLRALQKSTWHSRQLTDLIAMCPFKYFGNLLGYRYEFLIAIPAAH